MQNIYFGPGTFRIPKKKKEIREFFGSWKLPGFFRMENLKMPGTQMV